MNLIRNKAFLLVCLLTGPAYMHSAIAEETTNSKEASTISHSAFFAWSEASIGMLRDEAKLLGFDEEQMKAKRAAIELAQTEEERIRLSAEFRNDYYLKIGIGALRGLAIRAGTSEFTQMVDALEANVVQNLKDLPLPTDFLMIYEPINWNVPQTLRDMPCWTTMTAFGCMVGSIFHTSECVATVVGEVLPRERFIPAGTHVSSESGRFAKTEAYASIERVNGSPRAFTTVSNELTLSVHGWPHVLRDQLEVGFQWPLGPRDMSMCVDGRVNYPDLEEAPRPHVFATATMAGDTYAAGFWSSSHASMRTQLGIRDQFGGWHASAPFQNTPRGCDNSLLVSNTASSSSRVFQASRVNDIQRCWFTDLRSIYRAALPLIPYDAQSTDPDLKNASRIQFSILNSGSVDEDGSAWSTMSITTLWYNPRVLVVRSLGNVAPPM